MQQDEERQRRLDARAGRRDLNQSGPSDGDKLDVEAMDEAGLTA